MEFGKGKCAMLVMKSCKQHVTDRMELPNEDNIRRSVKRRHTNIWIS